jgi:hypothetical protein
MAEAAPRDVEGLIEQGAGFISWLAAQLALYLSEDGP